MLNPTVTKPKKRSGALDLLRFLAVIAVFYGHYADTFNHVYQIVPANLSYRPVLRYVTPALMVFFMVSSFVVTMTTMKRTVRDFVIIRLARLYPLFWLSCAAALFISHYYPAHSYLPHVSIKSFLINLTMVPQLFGYQLISPIFHTLTVELIFYASIIVIMVFKLWDKILVIISILLALCFLNLCFNSEAYVMVTHFTGGMLFYFIFSKKYTQWKVYVLLGINTFLSVMSAKFTAANLNAYYHDQGSNPWILGAVIFILYGVFLLISTRKLDIPGYFIFRKLGEIAYPFYLFHLYFLGLYWYYRNSVQPDLLLLCILTLIIICAWILNVIVEKPLSKIASLILVWIVNLFTKKPVEAKSESLTHQF